MDLKQAAVAAVIELETKLHFDLGDDGARMLTPPDFGRARGLVLTAGHLLPSTMHNTLLLRIAVVECWLAGHGAKG
ncbi:hypothetical protein [Paraburkholderia aspalathi]|uniref:hypothetical protein n=1 Tax=Paraburkholderia aspalathi TaxID=1324617 RepID=UPI0038BCD209